MRKKSHDAATEGVSHVHLVLLQPVLQVLGRVAVVQRCSESTQGLFLALIEGTVDLVYFTGKFYSSGILRSALDRG